jgi:hypothetical protein
MDRNLGAAQPGALLIYKNYDYSYNLYIDDSLAYGDLFQWGRRNDGHQCRNSLTTSIISSTDQPPHNKFILNTNTPYNWRNNQATSLWNGLNGINNPCPYGYRVPSNYELEAEFINSMSQDSFGLYKSPLKFTLGGYRPCSSGEEYQEGYNGYYWPGNHFNYYSLNNYCGYFKADGLSVRCIKGEQNGAITTINCGQTNNIGRLYAGKSVSGVKSIIPYNGGNGSSHNGLVVNSTGIIGLTATLLPGNFAIGNGNLIFSITGTPLSNGIATFNINVGGQNCILYFNVSQLCSQDTTIVVEVVNPTTGKIWMDRNLGAKQVANSITDTNSFGDLYQWGRGSDGHQCRKSQVSNILSNTDRPNTPYFIITPFDPYNWRSVINLSLWQGVDGINNPCPYGYRIPTFSEFDNEIKSWNGGYLGNPFSSALKFTFSGYRDGKNGIIYKEAVSGCYWTSDVSVNGRVTSLSIELPAYTPNSHLSQGNSIRCIKN